MQCQNLTNVVNSVQHHNIILSLILDLQIYLFNRDKVSERGRKASVCSVMLINLRSIKYYYGIFLALMKTYKKSLPLSEMISFVELKQRFSAGECMITLFLLISRPLSDLQDEFDKAWAMGNVNNKTWISQRANDKTVLAYKLLLQTGKTDDPLDYGRIGCRPSNAPCDRVKTFLQFSSCLLNC